MAISVFSKLGTAFSLDLGLRVFFDSPRIEDLARLLEIRSLNQQKPRSAEQDLKDRSGIIDGEI
jgi:hypothetical protein